MALILSQGVLPARIERFDLATRHREVIRVIAPADLSGVTRVDYLAVADDPDVYAYAVRRQLSRLFLLQGAR